MGIAPGCEHVTQVPPQLWGLRSIPCDNMLSVYTARICASDFGLFGFFPSLPFLLLLAVLSCCSTVSLDINHMVFSLSHCDNNSCLIIFCENFTFTTAAFRKRKSTKNTQRTQPMKNPVRL